MTASALEVQRRWPRFRRLPHLVFDRRANDGYDDYTLDAPRWRVQSHGGDYLNYYRALDWCEKMNDGQLVWQNLFISFPPTPSKVVSE